MERSKTYHLALMGLLTALLFMGQVIMSFLPNIEIISLLVILYTIFFGRKVFWMIYVFVFLEGFLYGFGMWFFNYLYVWTVLALAAMAMKRLKHPLWWALLSGLFGLAFGLLCAPVYIAVGGVEYAFAWWISGLPFDYPHAIGNFVIALCLFVPLRKLLAQLYSKMHP